MSEAAGTNAVYAFADSLAGDETGENVLAEEQTVPWVAFDLAGESYALPIATVQEIIRVAEITRVPDAPAVVRGVVNLRGRVLPVVDLRLRLGLPAIEVDTTRRILVLPARGRLIGVLVDAVSAIERVRPSTVQPVPRDVLSERSDYFLGVARQAERLLILLDAERVLLVHDSHPSNEATRNTNTKESNE
jgi:purine-binding chemotaxis protein CheW